MQTDSEQLLQAGVAVGERTFEQLLSLGVNREQLTNSVCHQVGATHRRLMLERLGLPENRDYSTFQWLGNTGSVALPTALAMALKSQFIQPGAFTALLGIGSGINSVMLTTEWQQLIVAGDVDESAAARL